MITNYINYLMTLKGYSKNTAEAYEKDLRNFARWARKNLNDARWSMITRADLDRYIADLVSAGLKPATTNRRLAAIAGLYRYFKREGKQINNPCQYESRRKVGERVPNTIPEEELQIAYENAVGVTKVMLGLLSTTGMRIQEMLDLRWQDIDFKKSTIRVKGKGNKERIVYSTPQALEQLGIMQPYTKPNENIFTLSQRDARRMIFAALKPYSTAKQLSPHAIRHTFATNLAAKGVNCSTLSNILGHKDLNTTQQYIDLGQMQAQQACLRYALLH